MTVSFPCKQPHPRRLPAWDALARGLNRIAGGILLFMMVLTLLDVLLRKFWSQGIVGGLELTEFMLVGMVFCALAQAEIEDRHVRVDLLAGLIPIRSSIYLNASIRFLSALMMGAISVSLLRYAMTIQAVGEVSLDLGIPRYPMIIIASLGCALLGVVILIRAWATLSEKRRP